MSQNYAKSALESSKSGDCAEAGDYYTQAAYQALAHDAITAGNDHQVGGGLDRDSGPIATLQNDLSLINWVEQKRETYPEMLEELDERGEW